MALFSSSEAGFARAVSNLVYSNPFLPERIGFERDALGEDFREPDKVWSVRSHPDYERPNVVALGARIERLVTAVRARLLKGGPAATAELVLYKDMVLYLLYYGTFAQFGMELRTQAQRAPLKIDFFPAFVQQMRHYLSLPGVEFPEPDSPEHVLGMFFQIRRAFGHIFSYIVGGSLPTAQLRANIWRSLFTHDLRRYYRTLYGQMTDMTTLITGASGTGKELVARAIACSRYIPFDAKTKTFAADYTELFIPLNLSALSPTLIESELFGHRRGAFTGAVEDRDGWLQTCPALGTVFLDEVGELDPLIQVKLLRVLQARVFQRLGDTATRRFEGKIVAATNRNLAAEIAAGRFREDFFYRLCSDIIRAPNLREQLEASREELPNLVLFIAQRIAGPEAGAVAEEVVEYIRTKLPADYAWPGNFRELEQCVRNVLIRKEYIPLQRQAAGSTAEQLAAEVGAGRLTAEELVTRYCRLIYERTGTYEATARQVGLDRRTVKARVDEAEA